MKSLLSVNKRHMAAIMGILLASLYVALLVEHARTVRPWYDEAIFADPAWNLVTKGFMGTTVLEEAGNFPKINTYTYTPFPLYLVLLAGWFKVVGFGLLSLRVFSILCTAVFLAAFCRILWILFGDMRVAVLASALIAVDYQVMVAASFGRYEPLVAMLGFGAYALYLGLRPRRFGLALLLANACIAAAGTTHPNGLLYLCGLVFLVLYHDWRRISVKHLPIIALPYLVAATAWGVYILKAPDIWYAQLHANSFSRFNLNPWLALRSEIVERYLRGFGLGGHSVGHSGPIAVKAVILGVYAGAVAGCVAIRSIRQHAGARLLMMITAVHAGYLTFVEGIKFTFYLFHILPLYAALLAVLAAWLWRERRIPRLLIAAVLLATVGIQIGGILLRIQLNTYQNSYVPAVEYLKRNVRSDELVMADCAFGFGYGFRANLLDDIRLGYRSGKTPEFIVLDEQYIGTMPFVDWGDPALQKFIHKRLSEEFVVVYDTPTCKVYRRRRG